ncbi:WhiB family transcriptional regulator [Nocardiaceae bacterium NPDC056970]
MIQQARNRERVIIADRAYGAVNDWPEVLGEPIRLLAAILRDTPRLDGAACVDHDPEMWFADSKDHATIVAAKAICAGCPALAGCRDYARGNKRQQGILAGRRRREFDEAA